MFETLSNMMKDAGSDNVAVAAQASADLALAMQVPIREAIFPGDLYNDLFTIEERSENDDIRYATDLVQPGREDEFVAYTVPRHGAPPERLVEPDFIHVNVSEAFDSIEIPLPALRFGEYNVLRRAMQILQYGCTKKMNDDCFHAITAAGIGRGFVVVDAAATAGVFSKDLLLKMQAKMRRSTGSNASSVDGFRLGRIYVSPEVRSTIASFTNAQLDEITRREIITSPEGRIESLYGTEIRDIVELGVAGKYQNYATTVQGLVLPTPKTELVIGVDLHKRDRLIMPMTQKPTVTDDSAAYKRRNLASYFVRFAYGTAVLDDRVIILGAC